MATYQDYRPERKIRRFARRHGLTAVKFTPPHEAPFLRVWTDDPELAAKMRKLYGRTRGGHTA